MPVAARFVARVGLLFFLWVALVNVGAPTMVTASGYATIHDSATIFTQSEAARINRAAAATTLHIVVATSDGAFDTPVAWQNYVRSQSADPHAVIIGLWVSKKQIFVVPGALSGLTSVKAMQAIATVKSYFDTGHIALGVIRMIQAYAPVTSRSGPVAVSDSPVVTPSAARIRFTYWPLVATVGILLVISYGIWRRLLFRARSSGVERIARPGDGVNE